ncbi:MAG: 2-hydroxyacyl-CoA dehydratase [Clostridiales bacterium]|nr:2-hydroxyacyl-CoA dehydratase [Clostridiales bacterium]
MSYVVKKFGQIVGSNIETHPKTSQRLLKLGYALSGLQMKYFPERYLLPHQIYASVVCNRLIRYSLGKPENSAVVNLFFPCELLHAVGIKPESVEGFSGYLNGACCERFFIDYIENVGIPKTLCSYHKTMLGAALAKVLPKPKFIMATTMICDANIITFRELADFWGIPLFTVDIPSNNDEDSIGYVENQLKQAVSFIEENTDKKFDYEKLKEVIKRENRSMRLYKEYFKELSVKYIPNDITSEMYKLLLTHILNGTEEAEKYFEMILDDAQGQEDRNDKIRILWCHPLPNWQKSIKEIINNSPKYQLLCSDLNFDAVFELDENNPLRSLAIKLLNNHLRGSADHRAGKILDMAQYLNADGVVYFNNWGCKKSLGGAGITKKLLEQNGIPVLVLDGDGCDRDNIND